MGLFSSNQNKKELALVFDIGSASVGGSFFYIESSGSPKILCSLREDIVLEKDLNVESFSDLTIKALERLVEKISKEGAGKPERIFCVLSLPWFHSETRNISLKTEKPFIFTHKFIDNVIEKEVELLLSSYNQKDNEVKLLPIEMKTMSVKLNGYEIKDPINQKATELEMPLFVSLSEEIFIKQVEEVIKKQFHFKSIKFCSFLMSSFTVGRDMFVNQDKFLLINIGGEITDISMVKKDVLRDSSSFPLGFNFLVRGLAKDLNISNDEARSLLHLYKDNHANNKTTQKLEDSISKLKKEWLQNFQTTLNNLSHDISVPSTVFITVNDLYALFFSEIIKTEQLNQYSLTDSKFRIIFLGVEALHGIASFDEKHDKGRDALLIIESIYINRFLK